MKHARPDYDRIQDPSGKIPADEPVFLIRAQDVTAPEVVRFWVERARAHGASATMTLLAEKQAERMLVWQREHGMKVPWLDSDVDTTPTDPVDVTLHAIANVALRMGRKLTWTATPRGWSEIVYATVLPISGTTVVVIDDGRGGWPRVGITDSDDLGVATDNAPAAPKLLSMVRQSWAGANGLKLATAALDELSQLEALSDQE